MKVSPFRLTVGVGGHTLTLTTDHPALLGWIEDYLAGGWQTWASDTRAALDATVKAPLYHQLAGQLRSGQPVLAFLREPARTAEFDDGIAATWSKPQRAVYLIRPDGSVSIVSDSLEHLRLATLRTLRDLLTARLEAEGWVQFHAACAEKDSNAVLILGRKGAGKTSTAVALVRNGWRLIANDRVMIRGDQNTTFALPWPTPMNVGLGLLSALSWEKEVHRRYAAGVPASPNQPPQITAALREGRFAPLYDSAGREMKCELMPYQLHDWFDLTSSPEGQVRLVLFPNIGMTGKSPSRLYDSVPSVGEHDLMPAPGEPQLFPDFLGLRKAVSPAVRGRQIHDALAMVARLPSLAVSLSKDVRQNAEFLDDLLSAAVAP